MNSFHYSRIFPTQLFPHICPAHVYEPGRETGFPFSSIFPTLLEAPVFAPCFVSGHLTASGSLGSGSGVLSELLTTGWQDYRDQTGLTAARVALPGPALAYGRGHLLPTGELLVGQGFPGRWASGSPGISLKRNPALSAQAKGLRSPGAAPRTPCFYKKDPQEAECPQKGIWGVPRDRQAEKSSPPFQASSLGLSPPPQPLPATHLEPRSSWTPGYCGLLPAGLGPVS